MNCAIVAAAGTGDRFGEPQGKQLFSVAGRPLVSYALLAVARAERIDGVIVACHADDLELVRKLAQRTCGDKLIAVVIGGATRSASVSNALAALPRECAIVAVHDGARPLAGPATIDGAVAALIAEPATDGVVVGHRAIDTIKQADDDLVSGTLPRETIWLAHTPQVFRAGVLARAYERAAAESFESTDDAALVEHFGGVVRMLEGPRWNVKVTLPEDVVVVEALLRQGTGER